MAVDEQSSQDSTLIDEDLVAALGFEPVESVADDVVADVPADDVVVDAGDIAAHVEQNGFGIDEVEDLPIGDLSVDEIAVDEIAVDEIAVDEIAVDEIAGGVDTDDVLAMADLDVSDVVDDSLESKIEAVPSISDDDLDVDATAPVGLVDLDLDSADAVDTDATDVSSVEVDALGVDALGDDVIDLDTVDLSDPAPEEVAAAKTAAEELDAESLVDNEVHELADADSVFADATPVVDPPAFDEPLGLPATETVGQVGTGLLDLDAQGAAAGTAAATATATATPASANKARRRLRARKSRRVIRHIDPWSVLTFSVLFHMVVFAALLLSSVLVWNAAIASGMVENVESFIQELGDYETFEINADVMFRAAIVIAGMLTLASSVLVVLLTVVFNLISDLVGGIRVTVIEEETVRVPIEKKRSKAQNE